MSPAFEEIGDTPTPAFLVIGKPTESGSWEVVGGVHAVYATEAEATQVAQAKVGAPDNWFTTRVCQPTGSLFTDAE